MHETHAKKKRPLLLMAAKPRKPHCRKASVVMRHKNERRQRTRERQRVRWEER